MVSSTEIGALRDADVRADEDLRQVVDPAVLAEPGMLLDRKMPRILDAYTRLDDNSGADTRPEQPEQRAANTGGRQERAAQKRRSAAEPEDLKNTVPARGIPGVV